jgi:hypothetical protein
MEKYTIVYHKERNIWIAPGHYLPEYKKITVGGGQDAFAPTIEDAIEKIEKESGGDVFFVFCGHCQTFGDFC